MSNRIFSRRYELPASRRSTAAVASLAAPILSVSTTWVGQSINLVRRALPGKRPTSRPQALTLKN